MALPLARVRVWARSARTLIAGSKSKRAGPDTNISGDNADGSYTTDSLAFQALGTRANGEVVGGLDY